MGDAVLVAEPWYGIVGIESSFDKLTQQPHPMRIVPQVD